MANSELDAYVKKAKAQGLGDDAIRSNLAKAGWSEKDVAAIFASQSSAGVPVPPPPHTGMWVTFQYIILFITLYISSISLGGILYSAANRLIPDAASSSYVDASLMQGYLAAIIVAFPIFAWLFIILRRQLLEHPGVRTIRARKVLFYITLVIAFLIMVGYVISIIYGLISGEITGRAIAHFCITMLIAGPIFIYLLKEVKSDRNIS